MHLLDSPPKRRMQHMHVYSGKTPDSSTFWILMFSESTVENSNNTWRSGPSKQGFRGYKPSYGGFDPCYGCSKGPCKDLEKGLKLIDAGRWCQQPTEKLPRPGAPSHRRLRGFSPESELAVVRETESLEHFIFRQLLTTLRQAISHSLSFDAVAVQTALRAHGVLWGSRVCPGYFGSACDLVGDGNPRAQFHDFQQSKESWFVSRIQNFVECCVQRQCFREKLIYQDFTVTNIHDATPRQDALKPFMQLPLPGKPSAVLCGGTISWLTSRLISLRPRATVGERFDFVQNSEGWLATDEMTYLLNRVRHSNAQFHITPIAIYIPHADEFQFDSDNVHVPNDGTTIIPILLGSHWVGVEIHRTVTPTQVQIVQTPNVWVNRVAFFVCSLLHIPMHRLQIQEPAYNEMSGMCGWSLAWRWINMLGCHGIFSQVERELATLSIDRRRIVDRTLRHSIRHWYATNCTPDLQQVAYTIRRSFLINLLQLQTSIHATTDSNAVVAVGHPMSCFETAGAHATPMPVETEGPDSSQVEVQTEAAQSSVQTVEIQTDVSMSNLQIVTQPTQGPNTFQHQLIANRREASMAQPSWAGSDELDAMSMIYQPFLGQGMILPCMWWDPDTQAMDFVSSQRIYSDLQSVLYCIIARHSHWMGVKIVRHAGMAYGQVFTTDVFAPDEWNSFVHCLAQFLQLPFGETRMQLISTPSPEGMCGYLALYTALNDMQCRVIPDVEHALLRLQVCEHAHALVDIANQALDMWHVVSQHGDLNNFAFVTRLLFLERISQGRGLGPFMLAGAVLGTQDFVSRSTYPSRLLPDPHPAVEHSGSRLTLSSLATRLDRFCGVRVGEASNPGPVSIRPTEPMQQIVKRLRDFRPVNSVCPCQARSFSAFVRFGPVIHEHDAGVVGSLSIVEPVISFPTTFRNVSVCHPDCTHVKATQGRIKILKGIWPRQDESNLAWITDATISEWGEDFLVDATLPHVGVFFPMRQMQVEEEAISTGELCCGGFSGWTQAAGFVAEHVTPIVSSFAIDINPLAASTYAANFGDGHVEKSALDVLHREQITFMRPAQLRTFQCDIRQGWWLQFIRSVDVLLMSPPCPAWSLANVAHGLSREDGFLTIEILLKATILQPVAIGLENVSNFMAHAHYSFVLDVIDWLGWKVKWGCKANLSDLLPQSRERCLLTLVNKSNEVRPEFVFRPWQKSSNFFANM